MYSFTLNRKNYIININKAEKLAEGNEGIIYDLQNNLLMKIYKKDDIEKRNKVYSMVEYLMYHPKSAVLKYTAWPIALVYDEYHKQVGYIMKNFDGKKLDVLGGLHRTHKTFSKFKTLDLFDVSISLIEALTTLRNEIPSLVIGDFSAMNVLVNKQKEICFIDMDSVCFSYYRCNVATPGYKAYETIISNNNNLVFTSKSDDFLTALITFSLISGYHPYSNNAGKSLDSCVKSNICALFNDQYKQYKPTLDIDFHDIFDTNVLDIYKNFFVDGCIHPYKRPSLNELKQALINNKDSLKQCKRIKKHQYLSQRCPYCKAKKLYKKQPKVKINKRSIQLKGIKPIYFNSSTIYTILLCLMGIYLFMNYLPQGWFLCLLLIPFMTFIYGVLTIDCVYSLISAIGYTFLAFFCIGIPYEILTWFIRLIF